MQVRQIQAPWPFQVMTRCLHLGHFCHPLPGPSALPHTICLTCTDVLGHDRQGVSLLLRFDEDGDSRGCRDLPEKAAHSLRGLLQQGSHILR